MGTRRRKRGNGKVKPADEPQLPVPVKKAGDENHGPHRVGSVQRRTRETDVSVVLDLDGRGQSEIDTGVPFLDHMLEALATHSLIDLNVIARGDLDVDPHHTVEDVGLSFGRALLDAVGDRAGIVRYGDASIPFDEALVRCYVDLCGRPAFVYRVEIPAGKVGTFDAELCEVFFAAVAAEGRMNVHLICEYGTNRHHIIEACFKSFARALERAVLIDPRRELDIASTKGSLE